MINVFIPSKDRACQLDLLLRSIQKNFPNILKPTVLYKTSGNNYAEGYYRVRERYSDWVNFVEEYNAEEQFYAFLNKNKDEIVGLFTDDSIFYREAMFTEDNILDVLDTSDIWCFSLRLGKNITVVDYVRNQPCPQPPKFEKSFLPNILLWDYRFTDKFSSYFAFPTSFDGCFYRAGDLLNLANGGSFGRMILWEHMICNNGRQELMDKPLLSSPLYSHVVVQQVNSSHEFGHYTNHTFNRSLEGLNKAFVSGKEIDLNSMDFSGVNCCHAEIRFEYSAS